MKRLLIHLALAASLTVPGAMGISRIPGFGAWFASGSGYRFFGPLFRAFDSDGGEQNTDIIVGTILGLSFLLSLAGTFVLARLICLFRKQK
ncbi:hypothetical protein K788_00042525 [Paraburkholderia caribensis MBA4]|uniref:Uncharacterized protein n=1 Tax=Paraburkholderia caribensis MBA4 TaxID=1323664 RepID=A0A0N7JUP0_9BURK|nr:hypothetical protein [Paraburkholderia caribensis]ALL66949.1 hypothetical protein K788_00042525 [Paraburkholderia caribensis MBA4]